MTRTSRRAAIYARISTDKQNPLSPGDQVRKCREYADRNGIVVADEHVYSDEGLSGLAELRRRKDQLQREIQRFAEAIAHGGPLDALVQQIATREAELKCITNKLLSTSPDSVESRLQDIRRLVDRGIGDLRTLLNRDRVLAKAELQSHLSEIRMSPAERREEWHYVAEGTWNLLGTGPNAPVLGLAHSDGCGGPIRTE